MGKAKEIVCQVCGAQVPLCRRVVLQHDLNREWDEYIQTCPDQNTADRFAEFQRYAKSCRNRQAFICEPCYKALDNYFGVGTIKGRQFGLARISRRGRAAVYNSSRLQRHWNRQLHRIQNTNSLSGSAGV